MIEYIGFDDAAKLRKEPQWRGRRHIRRDLKIVSIFIPWYMEWVKLLK